MPLKFITWNSRNNVTMLWRFDLFHLVLALLQNIVKYCFCLLIFMHTNAFQVKVVHNEIYSRLLCRPYGTIQLYSKPTLHGSKTVGHLSGWWSSNEFATFQSIVSLAADLQGASWFICGKRGRSVWYSTNQAVNALSTCNANCTCIKKIFHYFQYGYLQYHGKRFISYHYMCLSKNLCTRFDFQYRIPILLLCKLNFFFFCNTNPVGLCRNLVGFVTRMERREECWEMH